MIEILLLLCVTGAFCAPVELYADQRFFDEDNEAVVIVAVDPLRGVENLQEKSIPIFRLKSPSFVPTNNLREKSQLPLNLLGNKNLDEKEALSESSVSKAFLANKDNPFLRYPKDQYEHV